MRIRWNNGRYRRVSVRCVRAGLLHAAAFVDDGFNGLIQLWRRKNWLIQSFFTPKRNWSSVLLRICEFFETYAGFSPSRQIRFAWAEGKNFLTFVPRPWRTKQQTSPVLRNKILHFVLEKIKRGPHNPVTERIFQQTHKFNQKKLLLWWDNSLNCWIEHSKQ